MKVFFAVIANFILLCSVAQVKKFSVAIEENGSLGFNKFSKDSLIPEQNKETLGISDDAFVNAYFIFSSRNFHWQFKAGVGYSERSFTVRKYSIGDIFLIFIPFFNFRDTSYIRRVHLYNQYYNFPVGVNYRITKNLKHGFQVITGVQFTTSVLYSSRATAVFDSSYHIPTASEIQAVEKTYNSTSAKVVFSLQPRLDFQIRIYKGLGIDLNMQPLLFYLNPSNKQLMTGFAGIGSNFGIYYNF